MGRLGSVSSLSHGEQAGTKMGSMWRSMDRDSLNSVPPVPISSRAWTSWKLSYSTRESVAKSSKSEPQSAILSKLSPHSFCSPLPPGGKPTGTLAAKPPTLARPFLPKPRQLPKPVNFASFTKCFNYVTSHCLTDESSVCGYQHPQELHHPQLLVFSGGEQ